MRRYCRGLNWHFLGLTGLYQSGSCIHSTSRADNGVDPTSHPPSPPNFPQEAAWRERFVNANLLGSST
jgi:hypothetical protein